MGSSVFFARKKALGMKSLLTITLLVLSSAMACAQLYVEGIPLSPSNTGAYLEATALRRIDGTFHMGIDYGQKRSRRPHDCLTDSKGRRYEFRSAVDGLNYLYENGWEVVEAYPMGGGIRTYLLRRR